MGKKTKADPTGLAPNRNRATRSLVKRLSNAERKVKAEFRAILKTSSRKTVIVNAEQTTVYNYDYDPQEMARNVEYIINQELLENQDGLMPYDFYFSKDIEQVYRQGTAEEVRDYNHALEAVIIGGLLVKGLPPQLLPIEQVLFSPQYIKTLNDVKVVSHGNIKSLSEKTASQVLQRINSGIKAGLTPTLISNDISERFDVSKSSAKLISETEINQAYSNAKLDATRLLSERSGIRTAVRHISALTPTTRPHHASRHGLIYTVSDQMAWWSEGANRINCFIPATLVQGRFNAGLKSFYRGKVIKLMTRDGRDITVTPNHKVMTDSGLVAAAKINKGDNLLAYSFKEKHPIGVSDLDVEQTYPAIEDVFASLSKVGDSSTVGVGGIDFNGDERFVDKYVDRVFSERTLSFAVDIKLFKALDDISLIHANPSAVGKSSLYKRVVGVFFASPRIMGIMGVIHSFFRCHVARPLKSTLGASPFVKSLLFDDSVDNIATNAKIDRYPLDGHPCNVVRDNVVSVEVVNFSGHVYDIQEKSGLIVANGIIASNCKCTTESVLLDTKGQVLDN